MRTAVDLHASPAIFPAATSRSWSSARELSRDIKLMIAAQPTRGVDVGSIEYIHKRIVEARDAGVGVLIVSTELDEIMALSDRILVMFRGRIVAEFEGGTATVKRDRPRHGRGARRDARRARREAATPIARRAPQAARSRRASTSRRSSSSRCSPSIIALVLGALIMLATGVGLGDDRPLPSSRSSPARSARSTRVSETLTAATPLTSPALGLALGFRAGLFNIGAEGQLLLGGMAAVVVGFVVHRPADASSTCRWRCSPAALVGALWARDRRLAQGGDRRA